MKYLIFYFDQITAINIVSFYWYRFENETQSFKWRRLNSEIFFYEKLSRYCNEIKIKLDSFLTLPLHFSQWVIYVEK